jgi:hypothetical protein
VTAALPEGIGYPDYPKFRGIAISEPEIMTEREYDLLTTAPARQKGKRGHLRPMLGSRLARTRRAGSAPAPLQRQGRPANSRPLHCRPDRRKAGGADGPQRCYFFSGGLSGLSPGSLVDAPGGALKRRPHFGQSRLALGRSGRLSRSRQCGQ